MGWTKFYSQNRSLSEPDSWSRTPLDNMTGVELVHNDKKLAIYGLGKYWQSDTYETDVVPYGAPPQKLVARRIEGYIDTLSFAKIKEDKFGITVDFRNPVCEIIEISPLVSEVLTPYVFSEIPRWIILELDTIKNAPRLYTSKERI